MRHAKQLDNAVVSKKSVFFEKLIEHRFIADIMMYAWYFHSKEIRILRCEIDSAGYDIVIDCDGKYRFIQLRTSVLNSKRSYQNISAHLVDKENPCVIWIFYDYNDKKSDFEFKYLFWGADIDKPAPKIIRRPIYKKNYQTADCADKQSVSIKRGHSIAKGQFKEIPFEELFAKLFGLKQR